MTRRLAVLLALLCSAPAAAETVTVGPDLSQPANATAPTGCVGTCTIIQTSGLVARAPFDGTVVNWRVKFNSTIGSAPPMGSLSVVREGPPGTFTSVHSEMFGQILNDGVNEFSVSVPVQAGDYIGFDKQPTGNPGVFTNGAAPDVMSFFSPRLGTSSAPTTFQLRTLLVNASIARPDPPPPAPPAQPAQPAAPQAPAPMPTPGKTVVAGTVSGRITVRRPGSFTPVLLQDGVAIPSGSVVDSRAGVVAITSSSDLKGGTQTALFYEGVFKVTQDPAKIPLTDITLAEKASFDNCPSSARARASAKKPERHVWGKGKGRFRTNGNNSAATVRGTTWLVSDRCEGTLTKVKEGVVEVRDKVRRRTVTVRAGGSYLARNR